MTKFLNRCLILTALFSTLLFAPDAFSYEFISMGRCSQVTWPAGKLPLDYYINNAGYSSMNMSTVERIMADSFESWSAPCCSDFSANYAGRTAKTALSQGSDVVLSFEERNWPSSMGNANQTIAVTLVQGTQSGCNIYNAPILFNGVGFRYCEGASGGCTDLQAIATHEIGHNLGLDHSEYQTATMYYAYTGGTSARNLSEDDVAGVCALYPGSCSCSRDSDCGPNQVCTQGQCEQAPCTSDSSCPARHECNRATGQCEIPTCNNNSDCDAGYVCNSNNHCVSDCPVCRTCSENRDCGAGGLCNAGSCIVSCDANNECPGDSACFGVPASIASSGSCGSDAQCATGERCYDTGGNTGICATPCTGDDNCSGDDMCMDFGDGGQVFVCAETYLLCLNPDAPRSGLCPEGYTCHYDDPGGGEEPTPTTGCNMSNTCVDAENNNCVPGNDVCLSFENENVGLCSCTCTQDSDCGDDGQCASLQGGGRACVPNSLIDDEGGGGEQPGNNDPGNNSPGNNSPGNNDPGANQPDAGSPDAGGFSDVVEGDEDDAGKSSDKEQTESSSSDDGCGCAATPMQDQIPASWIVVGIAGLGMMWRRRR